MKVFVTGATGLVGTAVVEELIKHGHQVIGLARSAESAAVLKKLGASSHHGSLEDLESLRAGAASADGVIHCAFSNDFSKFAESGLAEKLAIDVLGKALVGSSRPLVVTSGVAMMTPGRPTTEDDPRPFDFAIPRDPETPTLGFGKEGVRAMIVRLSPVTHGNGGGGFAGLLINIAREKGVSAYVGSGENRWPAVHNRDAAKVYRLALEKGTASARYHAVAEEGIATKDIATTIGQALGLPTISLSGKEADSHFGFFIGFAAMETLAVSELTQARLGWKPTGPGLIADLKAGLKRS